MNAISFLLNDLQIALGMPKDLVFPLGTKSAEIENTIEMSVKKGLKFPDYAKQDPPDFQDALFRRFQKFYARKYFTYVTFVAAIVVALLSVIEIVIILIKYPMLG